MIYQSVFILTSLILESLIQAGSPPETSKPERGLRAMRRLLLIQWLFAAQAMGGPFLHAPAPRERIPDRDSTRFWGMHLGPKGLGFAKEINRLLPDHLGANLELEFSGRSNKAIFYWSPATVRAASEIAVGTDTIEANRKINPQQWGILLGRRFVFGRRNE